MNCEQARAVMTEVWSGEVAPDTRAQLEIHLRACAACGAEAGSLEGVWKALGALGAAEPTAATRERFYLMVEAYRLGRQQAAPRRSLLETLSSWWPRQTAWQVALAAGFLLLGVIGGRLAAPEGVADRRLAQLGQEVQNMRQLVTLSLLQQTSASDRLRGVDYSYRVEDSDSEVIGALVRTLNQDSNVNVRLAAVDALQRFSADAAVRREMRQSLPLQTSPLVQIAVIDSLAAAQDRSATPELERLRDSSDVDQSVKLRIGRALERLQ